MSIFQLAELQLIRENKNYNLEDILNRAITIRQWLDKQEQAKEK